MKDSKMFKRILRYMKPHFLNYVIAVLLTGVVVLCDILSPIIIGKSLDVISEPKIDINILILLFAASIVIASSYSTVLLAFVLRLHYNKYPVNKNVDYCALFRVTSMEKQGEI